MDNIEILSDFLQNLAVCRFHNFLLRNPACLVGFKKKPNALKRAIKGPAKNPLQLTRKRPVRCVDTISPDTFHLML